MKKYAMTFVLAIGISSGMILSGCANTSLPGQPEKAMTETAATGSPDQNAAEDVTSEPPGETEISSITPVESAESTPVIQGGPYGEISLSVPDGWSCETFPMDNGQLSMGLYGMRFHPKDIAEGYIELAYADWFGVCGTGLAQEQTTIAGHPASIGTYDNNVYWDFISFRDDYKGIIALTYCVEGWWETYSGQVMDILSTLSFDPATREGGAYIYNAESECDKIGLSFTLKNISPTSATLVFRCYDTDAPTGELEYGDEFVLEILKDTVWEEVPVTLEGDHAFHQIAYRIPAEDVSEQELDWEWLYGTLAPGTYRIQKSIMDFRGTGDFDKYTVYAQFLLT